jgi:hypothetical protein
LRLPLLFPDQLQGKISVRLQLALYRREVRRRVFSPRDRRSNWVRRIVPAAIAVHPTLPVLARRCPPPRPLSGTDLRGKRLELGKQTMNGTRITFKVVNARPVISTSLGDLALDSGAARLTLFGVQAASSSFRSELRTVAGSQQIGMVSRKPLVIEGRRISDGDAVAIPSRPEADVDGLLPLNLFKTICVCNSEGYVVFD